MDVQIKLLRVLQEREFERVGGTETIRVDVRVISATNRDLERMIAQGEFREDLYYRLNVFPIQLPPLRERPGDIPRLAEHFVAKFNRKSGKSVRAFDGAALSALQGYVWPGNVRELENVVERAIIVARGEWIVAGDLDFGRRTAPAVPQSSAPVPAAAPGPSVSAAGGDRPLQAKLHEQERSEIVAAIDRAGGNIASAARALGINRSTLYYRLRKHGLEHLLPTKLDQPD
jgi:transcriptional regulator with GAF, ATPase, and Fis domain